MIIDFAFLGETLLKLGAALPVTLGLFICSFMLGGVLALGVLALRMSRWPLASGFAKGYILIFRGSPLLIQLFLIYYGLGQFGVIRHSFLWPLLREPFIWPFWRWRSVRRPIPRKFCAAGCWRYRRARLKPARLAVCRAGCCCGGSLPR